MSGLKIEMKFRIITNSHDGSCSGDECTITKGQKVEIVNVDDLGKEFLKYEVYAGEKLIGEAFMFLQKKYEKEEAYGGQSFYCGNRSGYKQHTRYYILKKAKVYE